MMLESSLLVGRLRDIGLFGGLTDEVLELLSKDLQQTSFVPGEQVFREGEDGRVMYVMLDGEVEVMRRSKDGIDARVAVFGPGDWFGEMSILDVLPRSASVRAVSPTLLLLFTAQDLEALYRRDLKAYSLVVLNIAREMSRRLRVADGLLAELVVHVSAAYSRNPKR